MRIFSRNMPNPPEVPWTTSAFVAVGAGVVFAAVVLWFAVAEPIFGLTLAGLAVVGFVLQRRSDRRLRRMAADRAGENICSFVRAFDRRTVDPWVLRAIYEELQPYCRFRGGMLPLRATDRVVEDLQIDGEEMDYLALDIARRAWRCMERTEINPFYGRVETVQDLVCLLLHQPTLHRA